MGFGIIAVISILLAILAGLESHKHRQNIQAVPVRIHVNGTRGKSSTVRLIAGGLRQSGLRVLAKTSGTAARIIYADGTEKPLKRRGSPNIIEQVKVLGLARKYRMEVLVVECMAIRPEMQWTSEHRMLKSTIGVITNVRKDHTDEMGNTPSAIAETLALTIPQNGVLVTSEQEYLQLLESHAQKNNTTVFPVGEDNISKEELEGFTQTVFGENVACALKVCDLLGVSRNTALQGMQKVLPDPGNLKVFRLGNAANDVYFINAFAANDYTSTLKCWCRIKDLLPRDIQVIGLFNHRWDRPFRVKELVCPIYHSLPMEEIIVLGNLIPVVRFIMERSGIEKNSIDFLPAKESAAAIFNKLATNASQDVAIFGFGNMHGYGSNLITYLEQNGEEIL